MNEENHNRNNKPVSSDNKNECSYCHDPVIYNDNIHPIDSISIQSDKCTHLDLDINTNLIFGPIKSKSSDLKSLIEFLVRINKTIQLATTNTKERFYLLCEFSNNLADGEICKIIIYDDGYITNYFNANTDYKDSFIFYSYNNIPDIPIKFKEIWSCSNENLTNRTKQDNDFVRLIYARNYLDRAFDTNPEFVNYVKSSGKFYIHLDEDLIMNDIVLFDTEFQQSNILYPKYLTVDPVIYDNDIIASDIIVLNNNNNTPLIKIDIDDGIYFSPVIFDPKYQENLLDKLLSFNKALQLKALELNRKVYLVIRDNSFISIVSNIQLTTANVTLPELVSRTSCVHNYTSGNIELFTVDEHGMTFGVMTSDVLVKLINANEKLNVFKWKYEIDRKIHNNIFIKKE